MVGFTIGWVGNRMDFLSRFLQMSECQSPFSFFRERISHGLPKKLEVNAWEPAFWEAASGGAVWLTIQYRPLHSLFQPSSSLLLTISLSQEWIWCDDSKEINLQVSALVEKYSAVLHQETKIWEFASCTKFQQALWILVPWLFSTWCLHLLSLC